MLGLLLSNIFQSFEIWEPYSLLKYLMASFQYKYIIYQNKCLKSTYVE